MANKIQNLVLLIHAVKIDVRENYNGAITIFGEKKANRMFLGEKVFQIAINEISEQEYLDKVLQAPDEPKK